MSESIDTRGLLSLGESLLGSGMHMLSTVLMGPCT